MANPIIKILRGAGAPPTLEAGRIAIDQTNKNLYVGISDGNGGTINEIVGGSGTFATKQFVTDAVSSGTGSLGTMSTQNADAVAITGGVIASVDINDANIDTPNIMFGQIQETQIENSPIGATTPSTGAFTTLTASEAPTNSTDVVRKTDLDSAISALGSVFRYVGDISLLITGFDLDTLPDVATGAYYRVDVAGTYTAIEVAQTQSFEAKVGDAFVKAVDGWMKLDNVDAEVLGTANEISVSGDENAGYTVAIDSAFKTRVSDVESKTQNIDLAATSAGNTKLNGSFLVSPVGSNSNDTNFKVGLEGSETFKVVGSDVSVMGTFAVGISGTILEADGANNVTLGAYWGGETRVASSKLVGINGNDGAPILENFIIDGGEY